MKNNTLILSTCIFLMFSIQAQALSLAENKTQCMQYAKEDKIEADQLDNYLEQCLKDLSRKEKATFNKLPTSVAEDGHDDDGEGDGPDD